MYFGFENITADYGKRAILKNLTLAVEKGKVTAIIGENGCGKSTLLKTVFDKSLISEGNIILDGKSIREYSRKQLSKKIAYLSQSHSVPPDTTVYSLVSLGRYPHRKFARGLDKYDVTAIENALKLTGLISLKDRPYSSLSGGEAQRARIAMAVAQDAHILILDEPTTHLDVAYQLEVMELIKRLSRERGTTVLTVLHDINAAARFADRLCAIKDGNAVVCGTPEDVVTSENLARIFDIDATVFTDTEHNSPYFIANAKAKGVSE